MFEKKVTIYFSIYPIEVEVDVIQNEMVEDLIDFLFVVIQKELFEVIVMNYLMSKKEQYPNICNHKKIKELNHVNKTYSW